MITADLPPEDGHQNVACIPCTGERGTVSIAAPGPLSIFPQREMHKEPEDTQGLAKQGLVSSGTWGRGNNRQTDSSATTPLMCLHAQHGLLLPLPSFSKREFGSLFNHNYFLFLNHF